mmetsp:Transcript_38460/g.64662  ORF Transcript_38460/g.64662 Transcript_38460/m.64662 type:complete len:404 (-) Transcript_38460:1477-2688(-)
MVETAHALVVGWIGVDHLPRVVVHLGLAQKVHEEEGLTHRLVHLVPKVVLHLRVDEVDGPDLVLVGGELVAEDALALVLPQPHQVPLRALHLATEGRLFRSVSLEAVAHGEHHALEHAAQLTHVEQVMELGGCGEHLQLHLLPHLHGHRHQLLGGLDGGLVERADVEAPLHERAEDVVDGRHRGQRRKEDAEVALEAVGDVVLPPAGGVHRRDVLHVHDKLHVADGLVQAIHAALLEQLAHDLIRHLVAPVIHRGHADIVYEDGHLLAAGRAESPSLPLLHRPLHRELEDIRRGERRESDGLAHHLLGVERAHEAVHRRGLGRAGPPDQQRGLADARHEPEQELEAHGVERRDDKIRVARLLLRHGVLPLGHLGRPVAPLGGLRVDEELVDGLVVLEIGEVVA